MLRCVSPVKDWKMCIAHPSSRPLFIWITLFCMACLSSINVNCLTVNPIFTTSRIRLYIKTLGLNGQKGSMNLLIYNAQKCSLEYVSLISFCFFSPALFSNCITCVLYNLCYPFIENWKMNHIETKEAFRASPLQPP